jgi:GntR family transcriptional regulator/MocR family aminotransferase
MKRIPASFLPPITLDDRTKTPMYRQLYDWFRKAIIEGQMRPGRRVPSTRSLAAELKISRIPVLKGISKPLLERARVWLDPSRMKRSLPP